MTDFRVATWNVQNLLVAGSDDGPETDSRFNAELASPAALIDQMQPHVIALQEISTEPALIALQEALVADPERSTRVGDRHDRVQAPRRSRRRADVEPGTAYPRARAVQPRVPRRGELIDHLLASHWLVTANRIVEVRMFTALAQPLRSINDDFGELKGKTGSDHAAVMATLNL